MKKEMIALMNEELKEARDEWKPRLQLLKIPFPVWATLKPGWNYVGWISRSGEYGTFEELVRNALRSDHGEERSVVVHEEGAVCWYREAEPALDNEWKREYN